jgi:hypothetical protein
MTVVHPSSKGKSRMEVPDVVHVPMVYAPSPAGYGGYYGGGGYYYQ